MNHKSRLCLLAIVLLSASLFVWSAQAAEPQYKRTAEIQIGGGGGWDLLFADAVGRRLYVSHGTKVIVIDMDQDKVVGEITDTPGVHDFVAIPDLKRGFSSNGQENKASIIDLETLKLIDKVSTEANPDAMLYDPGLGEVYAFNGRGKSATAIDAKTAKVVANIPLGGKPEAGAVDPQAGRVYDNLEDKNEVVVIDTKTHKVVERWPIAPGTAATGMAIDRDLHRLIIGGGNEKMVMMDSTNGKVVATATCGQGVDAAAYDPATHLAFVSAGGSGTVTIAKVEADKLTVIQTLVTERGARTMTLDAKTHKIYLPNAKSRTDATSFKVLVYSLEQ